MSTSEAESCRGRRETASEFEEASLEKVKGRGTTTKQFDREPMLPLARARKFF